MLKIKNIEDPVQTKTMFDEYIPVNIVFGDCRNSVIRTAYWFLRDKGAILEVGVESNRGILRSITLVDIKKVFLESKNFQEILLKKGVPVFEKVNYDENFFYDEKGNLEMYVGKDKIQILFSLNKITSGLTCGRITCLFDQDKNFCGVQVSQMSSQEMEILKTNFIDRLCNTSSSIS